MSLSLVRPQATELKPRIVVFGVGGAGGNAVNNMIDSGLEGVEFVVANTDAQHLSFAKTDRRIQLGETITQGLGAGAHPEVGMNAAEESADEIHGHLEGAHMVFITCGMGGGTGTGAAPVIAKCARDRGILTVGVVTKPFTFEGRHRMRLADAGVAELQRYVDTLIVIPNQNLFRVANERTTFADAFNMADQVLHSGVRSITDLMILPGLINLDFADVRAVMSEMGKAMMGTGEASGDDRALMAAQNAIANPLLDETSLKGAKAVLVNITGGMDMTLLEVDEAANAISAEVDGDANIIFGAAFDPDLDGKIRVSVVATGMDESAGLLAPQQPQGQAPAQPTRTAPPAASTSYAQAIRDEGRPAAQANSPTFQPREPSAAAGYGVARSPEREVRIEPAPAQRPQPAVAQRELEPIVDPWVEEYESGAARVAASAPQAEAQGDLYFDRRAQPLEIRDEPRPEVRPEVSAEPARRPAQVEDDHGLFEEREPRRSAWSLFGRGKRSAPTPPSSSTSNNYAPQDPYSRQQMRHSQATQPAMEPEAQVQDDLEIPSFLRRLAN